MKRLLVFSTASAMLAACTSLLGDFSVSSAPTDDGGTPDGAPSGKDSGGEDTTTSTDGAGEAGETGSGDTSTDSPADVHDSAPDAACDLPHIMCSGACIDPNTSSGNCGTCGHDCEGATCTGGVCDPNLLLMNEFNVQGLTIDGVNVYWTQSGTAGAAKQIPLLGASAPLVIGQGIDSPTDIALDGVGGVYFLASNTNANIWNLYHAKINVAASAQPYFASQTGVAFGVGADQNHVYYSVRSSFQNADYVINSIPSGGGTVTTLASGNGARVLSIAVATNDILFQDQIAGHISAVSKVGGLLTTIGSGWNNLGPQLVFAGGYAIWSNQTSGGGNLVMGQLGGTGSGQQIVPFIQNLRSLATDGNLLFFTDDATGDVGSVTISGANLQHIVQNRTNRPTLVAANLKYVVWYENNSGSIYKLVR